MEDSRSPNRQVIREEIESLLTEMQRDAGGAGGVPPPARPLARVVRWCVEVAGAVLVGLLCGIVSHAAVLLLGRALR